MSVYALGDRVPDIHPDAYVHPDATIIGDVTLGAGSSVWPGAVLRGDYGSIVVGERTSIQDGTVVHATDDKPTRIGSDCVVGHIAHLEGCTVEDRCLVGSGSVVLHDVVVRSGALVGAGAVVSNGTEVPGHAMALGIPAKMRPDAVPEGAFDASWRCTSRTARVTGASSESSADLARRAGRSAQAERTTLPALRQDVQTLSFFGVRPTMARTVWMLGFQRRRVRRWEWLTDMPKPGPLPQTSQLAATEHSR